MMKIHIVMVMFLVGIISGCVTTQETSELQILVERLVDTGKSHDTPPEAVKAHAKLKQLGISAYPVLVLNVHDKRPACLCFSGDIMGQATVGETCLDIISMQVEKYSYRGKAYPSYLTPDSIEPWWRDSKGKSLVELQIEALQWTIAQLETNKNYAWLKKNGTPQLNADLRRLKTKGSPTAKSTLSSEGAPSDER
jgi:hypothetical protein